MVIHRLLEAVSEVCLPEIWNASSLQRFRILPERYGGILYRRCDSVGGTEDGHPKVPQGARDLLQVVR